MSNREEYIKVFSKAAKTVKEFNEDTPIKISLQCVEDILELLKEQEAVKPRVSSVEQRCGNCNKVIEMDGWKACPWCGKPILWEAVGRSVKEMCIYEPLHGEMPTEVICKNGCEECQFNVPDIPKPGNENAQDDLPY